MAGHLDRADFVQDDEAILSHRGLLEYGVSPLERFLRKVVPAPLGAIQLFIFGRQKALLFSLHIPQISARPGRNCDQTGNSPPLLGQPRGQAQAGRRFPSAGLARKK